MTKFLELHKAYIEPGTGIFQEEKTILLNMDKVLSIGKHATFNDDRIISVISFDEVRDNDILVLESFEKIKKMLGITEKWLSLQCFW